MTHAGKATVFEGFDYAVLYSENKAVVVLDIRRAIPVYGKDFVTCFYLRELVVQVSGKLILIFVEVFFVASGEASSSFSE